jgi:hypothetical protein
MGKMKGEYENEEKKENPGEIAEKDRTHPFVSTRMRGMSSPKQWFVQFHMRPPCSLLKLLECYHKDPHFVKSQIQSYHNR